MNASMIKARSIARKLGVINLINRFRPAGPYEERVNEELTAAIKPGDVVWDVGANEGVYSKLFCELVGSNGAVVAFEPWEEACRRIRERMPNCEWLHVENRALGDSDTAGWLKTEEYSAKNHIVTDAEANGEPDSLRVEIARGDTAWRRLGRTPHVVKIDVEGFEEEVLEGMAEMLTSPELRMVLVEVHFQKLEMRGRAIAPVRIEAFLKSKDFQTTWVDSSHLVARRRK